MRVEVTTWSLELISPDQVVPAPRPDLDLALVPFQSDPKEEARLKKTLDRSPQERLQAMLKARER